MSFIKLINCESKPTDDEEVVVYDIIPSRFFILATVEKGARGRGVQRMAPNLLSPFIS